MDFELLHEKSCISEFDCGMTELNSYLIDLALLFQHRRFGITTTFFDNAENKKVIGFYTLCPACVQQDALPQKFLTGPKPNPIPGFRICRLAVDKSFQGKGIGQTIFIHALKKCLDQANQIGGSVIVVDAKNVQVKAFYERFGFVPIRNHPLILIQSIKYVQLHFS